MTAVITLDELVRALAVAAVALLILTLAAYGVLALVVAALFEWIRRRG